MSKTLTISIAAYNIEKYIEETLKSLLVNNIEDLEILVEDDGGTDGTANIVREYEKKYPGIVKLVHKENEGYGSTINKSIELAEGKYFKQLDGDDWYDAENFVELLELLRTVDVDAVYTPYKKFFEKRNEYELKDYFNNNISGEYNADDVINKASKSLEMFTMAYRTEILKENKINLLTKCLYTDREYALYPMMYVNTIYISHLPIYVYRIGREDQSVSVPSRRKHYQEQIKVTKRSLQIAMDNLDKMTEMKTKYILNYIGLAASSTISCFLIILPASRENLEKIKEFERYIYETDRDVYKEMIRISKILQVLKKMKYNYIIYKLLSKYRINKMKKI